MASPLRLANRTLETPRCWLDRSLWAKGRADEKKASPTADSAVRYGLRNRLSREGGVPGTPATPAATAQLPFDQVSDNAGISPTADLTSDGVPVGTELAVRLQLALSSADAHAGDSFTGVLDAPIVLDGKRLLPRGTPVTGIVLAAHAFDRPEDPGYLRLTLVSISVNGKQIALRTSNIFAKGSTSASRRSPDFDQSVGSKTLPTATGSVASPKIQTSYAPANSEVRFSTGHRFTFRLTEPLHLPS